MSVISSPGLEQVACFFLISDRKDADPVTIEPIQYDVAAAPEFDRPFAKRGGHVFNWPSNMGLMGENLNAGADRMDRPANRSGILWSEKTVESLNVCKSRRRPYQLWQGGSSASSPASSFSSHASASSIVRCWPLL